MNGWLAAIGIAVVWLALAAGACLFVDRFIKWTKRNG